MNKLFNVPAETRELAFLLETYQKNRIVNKIIRLLAKKEKYDIVVLQSLEDSRIFEIRTNSDKKEDKVIRELKEDICSVIKQNFKPNYLFDFGSRRLGFTNSFNVFTRSNKFCFECYHRIKEIRNDGSSVLPEPTNQIKG